MSKHGYECGIIMKNNKAFAIMLTQCFDIKDLLIFKYRGKQ
ncbi:uncharacterized protein METZ01_LOCUS408724 [marine metagenome]|uniref:Uncharacterized protein n=1 Tax=marine metagenome TaxID=408172 RepID=A0A382WBK4_9ZZZZ